MKIDSAYFFTLTLDGVDERTNNLEDILYEAGCDDALIHFRSGTVYLDFDREADNFESAVLSAIHDIETSSLNAIVIGVAPDDLVGESDIAKRLDMKRQAISLWVKGIRSAKNPFPKPIKKIADKSPLWRWYSVAKWLYQQKKINDIAIVERAKFIENINAALIERDAEITKERRALIEKLKKMSKLRSFKVLALPSQLGIAAGRPGARYIISSS